MLYRVLNMIFNITAVYVLNDWFYYDFLIDNICACDMI